MADTSTDSVASRVFAIAELREAILIELALLCKQDRQGSDFLHRCRPIFELFQFQRVNHAFATTILKSPQLRSLMYGIGNPLAWFLSTLNMHRRRQGRKLPRDLRNERLEVSTNFDDMSEERWILAKDWLCEEASWRKIRVFGENGRRGRDVELYFFTSPISKRKRWMATLRRADDPTLGTVYDYVQEMARACEPEIFGFRAKQLETETVEIDAVAVEEVTPPSSVSAMATVFAIAELRETILSEYALDQLMDGHRDTDDHTISVAAQHLSPALGLFPLQRVCHTFAGTICTSPQLRSLMCLAGGVGFISPLDWFLYTLGMSLTTQDQTNAELIAIWTNIKDGEEERWVLPNTWNDADASWRKMKLYAQDSALPDMHLDIMADPFDDEFEEGPLPPNRTAILKQRDDPTLGTVYELIEEVVRECELRIRRAQTQRDKAAAEHGAESNRSRIAYYGEEINAMYPRGSTPPPVREEYRELHRAQRREQGREFPAWCKAQRQREYEAELLEHRGVCGYCGQFDIDEG